MKGFLCGESRAFNLAPKYISGIEPKNIYQWQGFRVLLG